MPINSDNQALKLTDFTVKELVSLLTTLKGGSLGADPYRDPNLNSKQKLIIAILAYSNDEIISAVNGLLKSTQWSYSHTNASLAGPKPDATQDSNPEPRQEEPQPMQNLSPEAQIAKLLTEMAQAKKPIDEDAVRAIVKQELEPVYARIDAIKAPVRVEILEPKTQILTDAGLQHRNFSRLLAMTQARMMDGNRLNIWLKGPAGTGKTTAAANAAKALNLNFQFNGAISTEYELMGFRDAHGTYHTTAFREIFEHGGVYLFDEIDSSLPKALLAFNAALSNGACRFPDKMVTRHPDCIVIAGANTAGNGGTSDYVGRMKQDMAFLNRFVFLDWPLDEALETALSHDPAWVDCVQGFRSGIKERGIKGHIVSPRATFYGQALLAAGMSVEETQESVLRGGLTDEQWGEMRSFLKYAKKPKKTKQAQLLPPEDAVNLDQIPF